MAQKPDTSSFKYVTIERDETELVIMAGSHEAEPEKLSSTESKAAVPISKEAVDANPSAERAEEKPAGKPAKAADEAYRETMLEDLDHEPMSKMQRAVLFGIAVLVVAFIAYVLFF